MALTVGQRKRARVGGMICVGFAVALALFYGYEAVHIQAQIADYAEAEQKWASVLAKLGIDPGMDVEAVDRILLDKLDKSPNIAEYLWRERQDARLVYCRHWQNWENPVVDLGARMATFSDPKSIKKITAFWPAVVQVLVLLCLGIFAFHVGRRRSLSRGA